MPLFLFLIFCFSALGASTDSSASSGASFESSSSIPFSSSSLPPTPPHCGSGKGKKTKEQFFPCARFIWSPVFPDNEKGVAFLGEVGGNNLRLGITYGAIPSSHHRYKLSGEYLVQKTSFRFDAGRAERWLHQAAAGATYQYIANCDQFFQGMQVNGVYADAFNLHVGQAECKERKQNHPRRIAGAWYARGDIGAIISPWCDSLVILSVGYAEAEYNRRIHPKKTEGGPSLRLEFAQALGNNWAFTLEGDFKRPFNALEGQFTFSRCCEGMGHFTLGLFASHTWGKGNLQNVTSAGVELGWSFGIDGLVPCCEDPCKRKTIPSCCEMQDLMAWVSAPAVYMPQVLAISESCTGPASDRIPSRVILSGENYTILLGQYFTGSGLTYSIQGLPPEATFNSHTGVLKGFNDGMGGVFHIFVEAKTKCSSTKRAFTLIYEGGA